MKTRTLRNIGFVIFGLTILYGVWINLPPTINRFFEVQFANEIIPKIDEYKKTHRLPESHDWETLRQFGFRVDGDVWTPQYEKINDDTYQLIFVQGFDGPYLLWTSSERKWKVDMPVPPEQ